MDEVQRQTYLQAFGIENYMPRWLLPAAPAAVQVYLPVVKVTAPTPTEVVPVLQELTEPPGSAAADALAALSQSKPEKIETRGPVTAASILSQLESKPQERLQPFSLSVWRPQPGFLLVDTRDTSLALPTELLLANLLKALFALDIKNVQEEVLRWPAVENRFVSRTAEAARGELQTWLAVEHELRPISRLWLMGDKAARYFLPAELSPTDALWAEVPLPISALSARILPSLNQFLQQPLLKSRLWSGLNA